MMKLTTSLLSIVSIASVAVAEQTPAENSARTTAYRTGVSQDQLRKKTSRVASEIAELLKEYAQIGAAAGKIKETEAIISSLESLSETQMAKIALELRDASRADSEESAKVRLVAVNKGQTAIQTALQSISDRLALQKDMASMEQRITALILRQMDGYRDTMVLTNGVVRDWERKKAIELLGNQQNALADEIQLAVQTLGSLSNRKAGETFAKAFAFAEQSQIQQRAAEAATDVEGSKFPEAIALETQVVISLKGVLQALQSDQDAQAQVEKAAEKLHELASQQEQLGDASKEAWGNNQDSISERQNNIADQLSLVQDVLNKNAPPAGSELSQVRQEMKGVSEQLDKRGMLNDAKNRANMAIAQNGLSDKLDAVADALDKQLGNSGSAGSDSSAGSDPTRDLLTSAAEELMDAQREMSNANNLMSAGANEQASQLLSSAQSKMDGVQSKVTQAGAAVGEDVGKNLGSADANMDAAQKGIGQGSKKEQEQNRWKLDQAGRDAAAALKGLQAAVNGKAAESAFGEGGTPGKGEAGMSTASQLGSANASGGAPGKTSAMNTSFSALNRLDPSERAALSLLQREKAPAEYAPMVQQYMKNLADGQFPAQ